MSGFLSKNPSSDWTKKTTSPGGGSESEHAGGSSQRWDGPSGEVHAEAVLFEESGQYGNVFILRLSEFLKAFGAHSPRTLASMQLICEMALRDAVGPQGNYSLHGGAFFVFRFGHMADGEARRRTHAVVNDIGRRLLGDHFVPFAPDSDAAAPTVKPAADGSSRPADHFLVTLREEAREAADRDWEVLPASERGPVGEPTAAEIAAHRVERAAHARDATRSEEKQASGTTPAANTPRLRKAAER